MTSPIAQNRSSASTVAQTDLVGKRIALTLRRVVVFLTDLSEIVARVVCEFDSLAGDADRESIIGDLEACSAVAAEVGHLSTLVVSLVECSSMTPAEWESALSAVDERCSALTMALSKTSLADVDELCSRASIVLSRESLLDSTAAFDSCADDEVERDSDATCGC